MFSISTIWLYSSFWLVQSMKNLVVIYNIVLGQRKKWMKKGEGDHGSEEENWLMNEVI